MATDGQRLVAHEMTYLGTHERPDGSNDDEGGPITRWQKAVGLYGLPADRKPWCGTFQEAMFRELGIDDHGCASPSTDFTCSAAQRHGWFAPVYAPVPAGALMVKCGVHIEAAVRDLGPLGSHRAVRCIGGNVNDGVYLTTRSTDDFRPIVGPWCAAGAPAPITMYGFDDVTLAPIIYGPWGTKSQREDVIRFHWADMDHLHLIRRVYLADRPNHFAFEVVSRERWHFGPWDDKPTRDEALAGYARAHQDHKTRAWSESIDHGPTGPVHLTQGGKTT